MSCSPIKILHMTRDLFLALEPEGHLREFILAIGSVPCFLCKIYVKVLSIFGIVIVRSSVELDEHDIVIEEMKFRNLKVITYAQFDEHVFVVVESLQSIVKELERLSCVHWILSQIKEVQ